jgi:NADH-quinone oxidoreductase subunit K
MTTGMYILLALAMFLIGAVGVVVRRNAIALFMCIELMLNSVNLMLVTFSKLHGNLDGQVGVLFVMVIAAVEAAVGLAITLAVFRLKGTSNTDAMSELRG